MTVIIKASLYTMQLTELNKHDTEAKIKEIILQFKLSFNSIFRPQDCNGYKFMQGGLKMQVVSVLTFAEFPCYPTASLKL